jgi:glycosyltransferase involved in cell wall biosynthesis
VVVAPAAAGVSLDSDSFLGLDVREVVDVARSMAPDVVLVSGWHSVTQVRVIRAFFRDGVPLLYRGDSHLGSINPRWSSLSRLRARLMLRHYSGYLAVGSRSHEYLRTLGVADPAIVRSPHAVDNDAFRLRAAEARPRRAEIRAGLGLTGEQRVILYAGKLTAIKRPQDVIDAVARMDATVALFVGDGPERAALEEYARVRGVHCQFAGFMNQLAMVDAYVAADALMVPGRETWGLVANEALACGLPVVLSTDAGAASDLTGGGICVAVRPGDIAGFADALTNLSRVSRDSTDCASRCQAHISPFSFAAATRGLVDAAAFVHRHRRPVNVSAPARVVGLCGNLVFAGGMERMTFEALGALQRGGADVLALVNGWSSRPIAELAEHRNIDWQVGHYDAPLDGVFRRPWRFVRALGDVAMASMQLLRLIWQRRITHVFAADFRAVLLHAPALTVARLAGIAVLLRSGVAPTRKRLHETLWQWIIRPLVTRHIANSAFTAGELRAVGIAAQSVATIFNVVPSRHSSRERQERIPGRIAYVGQVIPAKGVLQLLDAVGLLAARGHDVTLDVAGQMEGWAPDDVHEYRRRVRARAKEPDLVGRVRLLGWHESVAPILEQASVHCCPSQPEQREGFGITVVEAKRAGTPSVVCPSGALPELIAHRHDGWITSGFEPEAIAAGLEWLLSDDTRLAHAQAAARDSLHRFDRAEFDRRWQEECGLLRATTPPPDGERALANVPGASK